MILFGATGYTGRLVVASLVDMGERPVLAGRTASRLSEMAGSLGGLDTVVADVMRPNVKEIVAEGDVLVSTVGPFTLYGNVALDAALEEQRRTTSTRRGSRRSSERCLPTPARWPRTWESLS